MWCWRCCSHVTDRLNPEQRSALMGRVRQRDTKPELVTRKLLHAQGFRFRLHLRTLPGTPDIVLTRHRKIVMVHGCFWHGHPDCARSKLPEANHDWWAQKIGRNRRRDELTLDELRELGWRVLVVWECETKDTDVLDGKLATFMATTQRRDGEGPTGC